MIRNTEKDLEKQGGRKRVEREGKKIIMQGGQEEGERNCHISAVIGEREPLLIGVAMAMVGT